MTRTERARYWAEHLRGIRLLAYAAEREEDKQRMLGAAKVYLRISRDYVPRKRRR